MTTSEIAERALMTALAGLGVAFRASRVDNAPDYGSERKEYPCIAIQTGGGSKQSAESLFTRIPATLTILTHYDDDAKRTTLAQVESGVMPILFEPMASSTIRTAYNDIAQAAGVTSYLKGITEIEGGMIEVSNKEQSIVVNMILHVCGS